MKLTKPSTVWEIPLGKIFHENSPARCFSRRDALIERLTSEIAEVRALRGIRQDKKHHGEKDVLEHTKMALKTVPVDADERVFWAVLLHDIGKSITVEFRHGNWHAHGHAFEGSRMAERLLWRIGRSDLAADVAWLVRYHHFSITHKGYGKGRPTQRQISFMENPLFELLLQVEKSDARASIGGEKGKLLELTERYWHELQSRQTSN